MSLDVIQLSIEAVPVTYLFRTLVLATQLKRCTNILYLVKLT